MRIGMFTDCYTPIINGVVSSIRTSVDALREAGHEVTVLAPEEPGYRERDKAILRFKAIIFPFQKEERVALPFPVRNFQLLSSLNLDVVHVHTPFSLGLLGLWHARKRRIPLVFTYHTMFADYVHYIPLPQDFMRKLAIEISRGFCNQCQAIIAPSTEVQRILGTYGVTAPTCVISSAVNGNHFGEGSGEFVLSRHGLPKGARILLFVGRLGKEKGLDFLLQAFRSIYREFPDVYLFLVGDGPERRPYEDLCSKLGIRERVVFTGYVGREEIPHYYAASYLFWFSSLTETQGLVLLEALAAGSPVVAVRATGVSEMGVEDEDSFFTDNEEESFLSATRVLLQDRDLRNRMGERGRANAKRFSPASAASQLIRVYHSAAQVVRSQ
ncbi:MAG: glycosyltransferase family 4 protein [Armatimonadetes bacterium]|nr:glycosyltransferase family 4 protein [Armatimonadota bacterium]